MYVQHLFFLNNKFNMCFACWVLFICLFNWYLWVHHEDLSQGFWQDFVICV